MRPERLPTVGRAAGEPLLSCLAAYGSEAGAAGHPGVSPMAPSHSEGHVGVPWEMQPLVEVLGPCLGLVPGPGLVVPNCQVVLAKPFIPPEDSSLGCTRSPCPAQGLLLSPSPVSLRDGGGWRDGGHLAMWSPTSAEPLRRVRRVPVLGGLPMQASTISQSLPPP